MMTTRIFGWVKRCFSAAPPPPAITPAIPAATSFPPRVEVRNEPEPIKANSESSRPLSAVEILQNEPNLTPQQLADKAGVTLSYARSLVRRRKTKPGRPEVVKPAAPETLSYDSSRRALGPVQQPSSSRTAVLERGAAGMTPLMISEDLKLPQGEVEFILKIAALTVGSTMKV